MLICAVIFQEGPKLCKIFQSWECFSSEGLLLSQFMQTEEVFGKRGNVLIYGQDWDTFWHMKNHGYELAKLSFFSVTFI